MSEQGIQATLFDYFQDTEYFTIQDANELVLEHQNRDVNEESIRARIYEGVSKGLFERVGKGLYIVTRKDEQERENKCLLINGDGRDLSFLDDNSIDCLICDHPYALKASLKGGNRNFADYDLFQYDEKDFAEKQRVLKPGHFCVEFLPEENGDNYQYLFKVKDMAHKAGLEYYASVPWVKTGFVANTGRKAKNTENVVFFSKGRARDLRPDAKKDKAEPGVEHFMSGAAGMLPTVFDVAPVSKKDKIHQAEKPVELLEQILRFVTKEDELVLDQFAGSGVLGEAAFNMHRNSILIEKDAETFQKITERLKVLGTIEALTPVEQCFITVGVDAIVARDAFDRTDDKDILLDFVKKHDISDVSLLDEGEASLMKKDALSEEQQQAIAEASGAVKDIRFCSNELGIAVEPDKYAENEEVKKAPEPEAKVLECSSRGDRRFSALFAKISIKGKEKSIEEIYQDSKRTEGGKKAGKGKPFDYIICPFTGDKMPAEEASNLYKGLWITYFTRNPDLVEYAKGFDEFHDMFRGKDTVNCQADVIAAYIKDRDSFVADVKQSKWYQNMTMKMKPSINQQIQSAKERVTPSQFDKDIKSRETLQKG